MPKIKKKIKVLFCAAEAAPLAKVGGLADVVGSLPSALLKEGVDARVLMPFHGSMRFSGLRPKKIASFSVALKNSKDRVSLYFLRCNQTDFYLMASHRFAGSPYEGNNRDKYLFFCRAAIAALPLLPFKPDIIHAHDFHASPIVVEMAALAKRPKLVLSIHNLQHQGWSEVSSLERFGFRLADFPDVSRNKEGDWVNLLAAGIAAADWVGTVSPSYAKEITGAKLGEGLGGLLRSVRHRLSGILNGIDVVEFNPSTDKHLPVSGVKLRDLKAISKQAVLSYFSWLDDGRPLLVFVARLSEQKGLDLFDFEKLSSLSRKYPFRLIFLGSGEEKYENMLRGAEAAFPDLCRVEIAFDENLARNLYAGADYFLLPSRFEPCGLTQMIAMRYGAVPIVRATGGLKDTVFNNLNGLSFGVYSQNSLSRTIFSALKIYYSHQPAYRKMQMAGLKYDWSWRRSAPLYANLYRSLLVCRRSGAACSRLLSRSII